ncbi:hypothetical protein GTA08_BOTSDO02124 [Neofusicoccum parvum]|nr:hypothetical protein GTA08_BOTSDO02124 [Neofusicoccum parvum]
MDALAAFDKLPFFFTNLYEKEALKLKEGQSEDWLDEDLRASARAAGMHDSDLQLPFRSRRRQTSWPKARPHCDARPCRATRKLRAPPT